MVKLYLFSSSSPSVRRSGHCFGVPSRVAGTASLSHIRNFQGSNVAGSPRLRVFINHLTLPSSVSLSGNTYKHYSTAFFSFKQPSFTIRPTFLPHLWSTKHIAQKMCSIFYLSTLSPEVYTHYPQSYPHPSLSILRQKIVIH